MTATTWGAENPYTYSDQPQMLLAELQKRKAGLIAYLRMKTDDEDWHGCADAAMDIREIEAKLQLLREGK